MKFSKTEICDQFRLQVLQQEDSPETVCYKPLVGSGMLVLLHPPLWDGVEWGLFFFFSLLCGFIIWPLALTHYYYYYFGCSLGLCHSIWAFELPLFISGWIFWLTDSVTKSGIIQICFAAVLKGTLQLNRTCQGYSFYGFSICALQSFYFCSILCRTGP